VVLDSERLIAVYIAEGTAFKGNAHWDFDLPALEQEPPLIDYTWTGRRTLVLIETGALSGIYLSWHSDGEFEGWYVNLQEPLRRTRLGFDTADKVLDIVIAPGLTSWRWKDEHDFERAQRSGLIDARRAKQLRREGERMLELMEGREGVFAEGWEDWKPPESWPISALPDGWDRLDV
jgi:hypothetical protein